MNKIKVNAIPDMVVQALRDNKTKIDRYSKIDEAMACVFKPDEAIASLPFIQGKKFALTDLADAKNAGVRVFTSMMPDISIAPVIDNEAEYERVDKMEQAWKWELSRMNRPVNGKKGVFDQVVDSALTYQSVAFQTEDLAHKFKGTTNPRQKMMLRNKRFQWTIHHPGTVHGFYSDYGLEHVIKLGDYSAWELIKNFGSENPAVQKLLQKHDNIKNKPAELMKQIYTLVDYTNWEQRVQYAIPKGNLAGSAKPEFTFMDELHGMPFINWVIVDYGDTLWQAVLDSGSWNNIQHMRLIKFAKSVALGMRSDFAIKTTDGTLKGIWIDYANPTNPIVLPPGAELVPIPSTGLDAQFENEFQTQRADVGRSTVARILQDPTPFLNSPYSTLNAGITTAMGQLAPAKKVAETAIAEGIRQGFEWIKYSEIPFSAYRDKTTDSKMDNADAYKRGGNIVITHENPPTPDEYEKMNEKEIAMALNKVYFDLSSLYIDVKLNSSALSDEQAKLNMLTIAFREMGMSQQEVWERMNWDGYKMNRLQRMSEIFADAEIKKVVDMKSLEVQQAAQQMQAQQQEQMMAQQQQMMQQQDQQNAINDMNAGASFEAMAGQDMRAGGNPAAMTVPNENRESITGRTRGGDAIR